MKPYIVAYLAKYLLRLIFWTCRVQIVGLERFVEAAKQNRCILMLWHNRLGMVPEILNHYAAEFQYVAFVSNSRDGEILSIIAKSYPAGRTIRVPAHNRHHALKVSIDRLKSSREILVFTPDGPRGPRYRVKPGIALAARAAAAHIVPFTWTASRAWQLKTWDGFLIPKPFSMLKVELKEPIAVGDENLNHLIRQLELSIENRNAELGDEHRTLC